MQCPDFILKEYSMENVIQCNFWLDPYPHLDNTQLIPCNARQWYTHCEKCIAKEIVSK